MINLNPQNKHQIGDFAYVLDSFYLWTNPTDQHVGNSCRNAGYWEPDLTEWMLKNIKSGWKCLDIGFNIGYYSEVLSRIVGEKGKVWAFEPNKELIESYKKASEMNTYDNCSEIIIFPYALSDKELKTNLMIPTENIGGASLTSNNKSDNETFIFQEVETKRLDSLVDEYVDFIKIDIEGHEPQAWKGFSEKVKQCPLIVVELGPYHPEEFLTWIQENYLMSLISGEQIDVSYILSYPHHLNVVLNKRITN